MTAFSSLEPSTWSGVELLRTGSAVRKYARCNVIILESVRLVQCSPAFAHLFEVFSTRAISSFSTGQATCAKIYDLNFVLKYDQYCAVSPVLSVVLLTNHECSKRSEAQTHHFEGLLTTHSMALYIDGFEI